MTRRKYLICRVISIVVKYILASSWHTFNQPFRVVRGQRGPNIADGAHQLLQIVDRLSGEMGFHYSTRIFEGVGIWGLGRPFYCRDAIFFFPGLEESASVFWVIILLQNPILVYLDHFFGVQILGEELQTSETALGEASPNIHLDWMVNSALDKICDASGPSSLPMNQRPKSCFVGKKTLVQS